ncbi:unnamed protein product [Leptidea sinapis]|uniref:BESS domain-containing protein n=1 Tax=Leptidea sinapis TaxID=189913 RepID=A0A5E4PKY4_9NEOP|nr:unnamed protein product [Leptidea sinapis]
MDNQWSILYLLLSSALTEAWQTRDDRRHARELSIEQHQKKLHSLPREAETKRRYSTLRPKDLRKKPSGYLKPLNEDDMENDEVLSVAVGPPAMRPKYEKIKRPHISSYRENKESLHNQAGENYVRDILITLGREFLNHQVSEDSVFGQYIGKSMKNLTSPLKLKMQHDILDLVVKYQRLNLGENQTSTVKPDEKTTAMGPKEGKERRAGNETEEGWSDFSNLANIVG